MKMGMHESDSYTASTMRRMKAMDTGPNSTPAGALQKRGPTQATGGDTGATPNSTPQGNLQKSTQATGKRMIGYPGEIAQVHGYGGIPRNPDPNAGGANQLQKRTRNDGF